ncbi:uncharacterized protein LOC128884397 isoform X2 [Hylaeus volcanicus]|uniref:uncharacterized protein LOC128884397 isoform X2 n=1 Tax=Hylaeus volcanicus TaxID=313075 RepID=UPI0023B7C2C7|nr:uncharacterized protein LOC128884397 isoform X2 [Hylaeus volcanicus]
MDSRLYNEFAKGCRNLDENCSTPRLDDLVNTKSVTAFKGSTTRALQNPKQNVTDLLNASEYERNLVQKDEKEKTTAYMVDENILINGTNDILDNPLLTKFTSQQSDTVYSFLLDSPKTSSILRLPSHYGSDKESQRQPANVSSDQLEHINKKTIYILHESVCYPVSWYDDTCHKDIKEMIFCTCDSIVDSAFVLREVIVSNGITKSKSQDTLAEFNELLFKNPQFYLSTLTYTLGRIYEFEDFHLLSSESVYKLEPSNKTLDSNKLRGNRLRRLRVRVDPFLHIESIRAINIMRKGANLLKHTKGGFPYLRQFQLSSDCERLLCYDSKDNQTVSVIFIRNIQGIRLGENSTLLSECQLPALRHLSFTIYYDTSGLLPSTIFLNSFPVVTQALYQSLYITCKDETEFENWVCGLKALVFHHHQLPISKEELMNHSRKFLKEIYTPQDSCTTAVPSLDNVESLTGLNDCLELPFHSSSDLQTKYYRLSDNWLNLFEEIEQFDKRFPNEYPKDFESIDLELNDFNLLCLGDFQKQKIFNKNSEAYTSLLRIPTLANLKPFLSMFSPKQTYAADDRLEYMKMRELTFSSKKMLNDSAQRLGLEGLDVCKEGQKNVNYYEEKNLHSINELLWKVQVDLENIHDMLQRLYQRRDLKYKVNFLPKNLNVTEEIISFRKKFSSAITSIMPFFSY